MDLFDYMKETTLENESPLASRMRPTTLEEVVGQEHIIGKDKLLYRAIKQTNWDLLFFTVLPEPEKPRCESDRQHDKRKIYPAECDHSRKKRYGGSGKRSATTSWNVREKDDSVRRRDPPV